MLPPPPFAAWSARPGHLRARLFLPVVAAPRDHLPGDDGLEALQFLDGPKKHPVPLEVSHCFLTGCARVPSACARDMASPSTCVSPPPAVGSGSTFVANYSS